MASSKVKTGVSGQSGKTRKIKMFFLKAIRFLTVSVIAFTFALVPGTAHAGDSNPAGGGKSKVGSLTSNPGSAAVVVPYEKGEIIVKFKEGLLSQSRVGVYSQHGMTVKKAFTHTGVELVKLPAGLNVTEAIDLLKKDPSIKYAEPNYLLTIDATPNDPSFNSLWGMHNTGQTGGTADADMDAPEAWDLSTGNGDVVVGVIDTGVDYNHEDLAANMWVNTAEANGTTGVDDDGNGYVDDIHGINAINGSGDPLDDNDHGTHVSGTIGAVGDNNIGVVGVNWNVKIMALKFLDSSGSGSTSGAIECVEYVLAMWAAGVNVRITSNSWGGGGYSQAFYDAVTLLSNQGILFIAAAGNDSSNNDANPSYPASYDLDNIISVAATDHNDTLASFSSYGATSVDVAAPGVNILSTIRNNGYASYNGTSMATPHVAGLSALLWSYEPGFSSYDIKYTIIATVDPISSLQGVVASGGRVNAYNALSAGAAVINYARASIVTLSDTDGSGSPEVAVLMRDTASANNITYVNEVNDGDLIKKLWFDNSYTLAFQVAVPDVNGNGADEITFIGVNPSSGFIVAIMKDASDGSLLSRYYFPENFPPVAVEVVPDIDGNGISEIAVLGVSIAGAVKVTIKDASTGATVSNLWFDGRYQPTAMAVVPDMDGNGFSEIAVLGVDPSSGLVSVVVKDASSGNLANRLYFPQDFTPVDMKIVPDVDGNGISEIAVLGVNASGSIKATIKDASTGATVNSLWFDSGYPPVSVAVLPDVNGNGSSEIAVLGVDPSNGFILVTAKDTLDASRVGTLYFSTSSFSSYPPIDMKVVPDMNGNGFLEIAVMGVDNASGDVLVEIRDTYMGGAIISTFLLPTPPPPPPPPPPDDHGNDCSSATPVAFGSATAGTIDPAGDYDYFRIDVPSSGTLTVYTAYTADNTDTYGYLQDSNCAIIASNDDSGLGYNFRIIYSVSAGTYYVSVRHFNSSATGSYMLLVDALAP